MTLNNDAVILMSYYYWVNYIFTYKSAFITWLVLFFNVEQEHYSNPIIIQLIIKLS